MKITVKDVVGPMPSENQCYILLSAESKILPLKCSYSDAEMCHALLQGENGPCPYEFFVNTLEVLGIRMQSAEIESVNDIAYSKLFFVSPHIDKPLRIASANPAAGVNASLAGKCQLEASDAFIRSAVDVVVQYHCLVNVVGKLWLLPHLDRTEAMEAVSDFLDKVEAETQA
jgi:hypothetical protein